MYWFLCSDYSQYKRKFMSRYPTNTRNFSESSLADIYLFLILWFSISSYLFPRHALWIICYLFHVRFLLHRLCLTMYRSVCRCKDWLKRNLWKQWKCCSSILWAIIVVLVKFSLVLIVSWTSDFLKWAILHFQA